MQIASFYMASWLSIVYCTNKSLKQAFCSTCLTNIQLLCLLYFNDSVIFAGFDLFNVTFNYYEFILYVSFNHFDMK